MPGLFVGTFRHISHSYNQTTIKSQPIPLPHQPGHADLMGLEKLTVLDPEDLNLILSLELRCSRSKVDKRTDGVELSWEN